MNDKLSIDQLIRNSIEKLNNDIEVRKSLFLNHLYRNIDALVQNAEEWFGDDIPAVYIETLNSLVNFSVMYSDQIRTFNDIVHESTYEVIHPDRVIRDVVVDFIELINMKNVSVKGDDTEILTSRQVFKDSLYNLFLCISQFYQSESVCDIIIEKKISTIYIDFLFTGLSEKMPDIEKLLRIFFTQKIRGESYAEYRMRLGLNISVENLKRIGGTFSISGGGSGSVSIQLTFPSNDFLKTVNDIRKHYLAMAVKQHSGLVFLNCEDKVMELLLSESLTDGGFKVKLVRSDRFSFDDSYENAVSLIFDSGTMKKTDKNGLYDFYNKHNSKKIVYICKKDEELIEMPNVFNAVVPFELDTIMEFIRN